MAVLLIDFGSTFTKVSAVDVAGCRLLGSANAPTTAASDIGEGLTEALAALHRQTGPLQYQARYACSSAAGGLRMAASGLVPELTAEAARVACLGAGAKVVKLYSYELTAADIAEIDAIGPDIFLLTGGTDGGNSANIIHNARMLAGCSAPFPILLAGNRSAADECAAILQKREVVHCQNVMPRFGTLNIEDVQGHIRDMFLKRIVQAKGLSQAQELVDGILMPTPAAMMQAMRLLCEGTKAQPGIGELMAVDLGGATTDVFSMAGGAPDNDSTILKGLPEPFAKRTVEGDIGMRFSAKGVLEAAGADRLAELAGIAPERAQQLAEAVNQNTASLPGTPEAEAFDYALASAAIEVAAQRHAGRLEQVYTPLGPAFVQTGKNLAHVTNLVATGGALIHSPRTASIAAHALASTRDAMSLRPQKAEILIDRKYILAGMGLLGEYYPDCALGIMKKELEHHGAG